MLRDAEVLVKIWDHYLLSREDLFEEREQSLSDAELWQELAEGSSEWRSLYQTLNVDMSSQVEGIQHLDNLKRKIQDVAKSILIEHNYLQYIRPDLVHKLRQIRAFHQFCVHPNDFEDFMIALNSLWQQSGFAGRLRFEMTKKKGSDNATLLAIPDVEIQLFPTDMESRKEFFLQVKRLQEKHVVHGQLLFKIGYVG